VPVVGELLVQLPTDPFVRKPPRDVGTRHHLGNIVSVLFTFAIRHRIEEAPGSLVSHPALDERHVVRRLDADHSEQLHEESRGATVVLQDGKVVGHFQPDGSVVRPALVSVCRLQALRAEGRALQSRVAAVVEALFALPSCQLAANDALTRGSFYDVSNVQQLRR
jgi:hypothetical protein